MQKLAAEQIEAIRKRAEAATEGPWEYHFDDGYVEKRTQTGRLMRLAEIISHEADADFVAKSREDIPALLTEVGRLRTELAGDGLLTLPDQVHHAREEISRLAELVALYEQALEMEHSDKATQTDEIGRLRAENIELRIKLDATDQSAEAVEAENERLRAFVERVTNPLDIEGIAADGRMVKMTNVVFDFDKAVSTNDSEA